MKRLVNSFDAPAAARFEQEFEKLVTACASLKMAGRHMALLHFLYSTGATFEAASNLKMSDLDLEHARATFTEYTARRTAFLNRQAVQSMRAHLDTRTCPNDAVFISRMGHQTQNLAEDGIQALFWQLARRARLAMRPTPQLFRAALIRRLLSNGADPFAVAGILGFNRAEHAGQLDTLQAVFNRCSGKENHVA